MLRKFSLLLFLFILPVIIVAQESSVVDSLEIQYKTVKSDSLKIDILFKLSRFYQNNDFIKSLEYANSALETAGKAEMPLLEAIANNKIGILLYKIGKYDGSLDYFLRSKKIYEQQGENNLLIGQIHNICGIYIQLQEYDKAQDLYSNILVQQKSLLEQGDSTNIPQMHTFYNSMGIISEKRGDRKLAQSYFKKALQNAKEFNYQMRLGGIYNNLGENSRKLGENEDALRYYHLAIEYSEKVNDKNDLVRAYISLTHYYIGVNDYEKALELANVAFTKANELGSLASMEDSSFLLFQIYKVLGETDSALDAHIKYHSYHDSLFNERSVKEMTRHQMLYEFEKKDEILKVEQKKLWFQIGALILTLIFGIIVIGLLYLLNKTRTRSLYFEKQSLEMDLEMGNKELTMNIIYLLEKNELIKDILTRLSDLKLKQNGSNEEVIQQIISDVESNMRINIWEEFELRFTKVHKGFYIKLKERFPNLSNADERLSALLSLGMTSKEIALITHQSVKSIEVSRTRLRKKLQLTNTDINLVTFLSEL